MHTILFSHVTMILLFDICHVVLAALWCFAFECIPYCFLPCYNVLYLKMYHAVLPLYDVLFLNTYYAVLPRYDILPLNTYHVVFAVDAVQEIKVLHVVREIRDFGAWLQQTDTFEAPPGPPVVDQSVLGHRVVWVVGVQDTHRIPL